jgi:hypothetical protein
VKRYTLSAADAYTHAPAHPDRTAKRSAGTGLNFDVVFQVWPSRAAMLKTIQMQSKRESHWADWRACKVPS